ncbi:MAG: serine--tRNA ligase, partial [Actinobacteria bacterium]
MIDLALIRSDPDAVRRALARRGITPRVDEILSLDQGRRATQTQADALRAEQKNASKEFAKLDPAERAARQAELAKLSDTIKT